MVHNSKLELESYLTRIVQQPCCPQQCTRCTRGKRVRPAGRWLGTAKGCTAGCGRSSRASQGARPVCCRTSGGTRVKMELSLKIKVKTLYWLKCVAAISFWSCSRSLTHQANEVGTSWVPQEVDECDLESFSSGPSVWYHDVLKWKGTKSPCRSQVFFLFFCFTLMLCLFTWHASFRLTSSMSAMTAQFSATSVSPKAMKTCNTWCKSRKSAVKSRFSLCKWSQTDLLCLIVCCNADTLRHSSSCCCALISQELTWTCWSELCNEMYLWQCR